MVYQKKTINNVPTKIPLSNSAPVGNPIGTIISTYKKIQPRNYLYCDGSTFDETLYPALYLYLGTNVLPDYRECAIVGAEKNTTDVFDSTETDPSTGLPGTQNHDVYIQGQFKDDQIQDFSIGISTEGTNTNRITKGSNTQTAVTNVSTISSNIRSGDVTRGKRKAVYYYIKAVDGVDISDEDTFLNTVKDYVDEKNSYSTDEILTGGTWIDGKPIYRKTFFKTGTSLTGEVDMDSACTDLDNVVTMTGNATLSTGVKNTLALGFTASYATGLSINGNTKVPIAVLSSYTCTKIVIVVEYTKTTD